jgi:ABC-type nitrate/sulfonate/bicarbonate transport system substrate-binding protein
MSGAYKSWFSQVVKIVAFSFFIFAAEHRLIHGAVPADKFTYAVAFPGATNAYFHIGKERGFFSQENIQVVPILMSIPTAHAALVSGQIDGQSYAPSTVRRGAPEVQVFSLNRTAGWFLLAKPSIKDIKELAGKTVTAGSVGGMAVELTKLSLVQAGLDPKSVIFLGDAEREWYVIRCFYLEPSMGRFSTLRLTAWLKKKDLMSLLISVLCRSCKTD